MSETIYVLTVIYFMYVVYVVRRDEIDEFIKTKLPRYAALLAR